MPQNRKKYVIVKIAFFILFSHTHIHSNVVSVNGWRVSEVPFMAILASAVQPSVSRSGASYFGDSPDSNFFTLSLSAPSPKLWSVGDLPHRWGGDV
jgi:hypothetical protein